MANILIVDDAQTDRELLGKVVTAAGHVPVYASDGSQALAKAKSSTPALVFLDVVMPGANGFETCRSLKTDTVTKAIPVVLVTSKSTPSDKFWAQKQGADGLIPKPFTPDSITETIRRFVK
jgi:two-component system, chemotaxis family, response regulator PixH